MHFDKVYLLGLAGTNTWCMQDSCKPGVCLQVLTVMVARS